MTGKGSVGRPTNNTERMERRDVPVAHDKPRINDKRKVRPHGAGDPAMGIRPSGGAQKAPKKPRLNTDYMQLRDVPLETMTEAELELAELSLDPRSWFQRGYNPRNPTRPIQGDAIAWHFGQDGITLSHVKNGDIVGSKVIPSYQSLSDNMRQASREYYKAKGERLDLQRNPRRVAADEASKFARENGISPQKMGELGREIPFNHPGNTGAQPPAAGGPGPGPQAGPQAGPGGSPGPGPGAGPSPGPGPASPGPSGPVPGMPYRHRGRPTPSAAPGPPPVVNAGPVTPGGRGSGPVIPYGGAAAPTPTMSDKEKLDFLRRFDPMKYSDRIIQGTGMSTSPVLIDQAFKKAAATPRGAQELEYFMNPSHSRDQMLQAYDPNRFSAEALSGMSDLEKGEAVRKLTNQNKGRAPAMAAESKMNEAWRMHAHREQSPMTIRAVIKQIRAMGMVCKWNPEYEEFMVNYPAGGEGSAYHTEDAADALGTAKAMHQNMMSRQPSAAPIPGAGMGMIEAYPDTSYERDEPSHESRIGDLGWHGHMEDPAIPANNREFIQARELHIERIHEVAEHEIAEMIENTMFDLGLAEEMQGHDDDEPPDVIMSQNRDTAMVQQGHIYRDKGRGVYTKSRPIVSRGQRSQQAEAAIPRIRRRWVGEMGGHLPKPTHPQARNIAGSGKDFRIKPGTNKSKKQPGNLVGSRHVTKVKPGFIG